MCVVDISCCDGNGRVFPTITQMPNSTKAKVWKTQSGKKKTTLEWWNHWKHDAPIYCFIFSKAAPTRRRLWWMVEGDKEQFCCGGLGQLSSPNDRCCWGVVEMAICHLWAHHSLMLCMAVAPSLLRLLLCSFSPRKCTGKLPKLSDKGNNSEINVKEKNPYRYASENQVISGFWASLL